MPELPEVETIRQDLVKKILNKKIVRVKVYISKSAGNNAANFTNALESNAITEIDRRGKLLIWRLKKGKELLLVHLKMTGQLIYEKELDSDYPTPRLSPKWGEEKRFPPPTVGGGRRRGYGGLSKGAELGNKVEIVAGGHKLSEQDIENLPNKFTRIAFVFTDSSQLFFNDQRLFGYMKLVDEKAVEKALKRFGPEPLTKDFTFKYFTSLFAKRKKTTVKAMLLNQELVAGLGNIYVDEVCFCAGVKPTRRVGTVTKEEQKKLFHCIPKILKEALKHRGTTFRNFLDSSGKKGNYTDFLRVYDRDGEPCRRCGYKIIKTRAAGRGTHFCPKCQK